MLYSQRAGESLPTHTLSGRFIAGSPGPTLAPLQAALPEVARWAGILAVAPDVSRRTLAGSPHRVAESPVLTLALLAAAWPPVFVITR